MLQRIQTLYMVLAAIVSIAIVLLFPMYTSNGNVVMAMDNPVIFFFFGFCSGGLLANIFNFKKRKFQVVLNRLVLIGYLVTLAFIITDMIGSADSKDVVFGAASLVPLFAIIMVFLANKGIMKDERLIKSADRIR